MNIFGFKSMAMKMILWTISTLWKNNCRKHLFSSKSLCWWKKKITCPFHLWPFLLFSSCSCDLQFAFFNVWVREWSVYQNCGLTRLSNMQLWFESVRNIIAKIWSSNSRLSYNYHAVVGYSVNFDLWFLSSYLLNLT